MRTHFHMLVLPSTIPVYSLILMVDMRLCFIGRQLSAARYRCHVSQRREPPPSEAHSAEEAAGDSRHVLPRQALVNDQDRMQWRIDVRSGIEINFRTTYNRKHSIRKQYRAPNREYE